MKRDIWDDMYNSDGILVDFINYDINLISVDELGYLEETAEDEEVEMDKSVEVLWYSNQTEQGQNIVGGFSLEDIENAVIDKDEVNWLIRETHVCFRT